MRKSTIRKTLSAVMAVTMLLCGAVTATASANEPIQQIESTIEFIGFEPFASEHISSWAPLLSRTSYGASVSFVGMRTGSIEVELQNSSGQRITSFTESFTNRPSISVNRARTTAAGTYRIVIRVTINSQTTTRESRYMAI
jgi:hypothetical protein